MGQGLGDCHAIIYTCSGRAWARGPREPRDMTVYYTHIENNG